MEDDVFAQKFNRIRSKIIQELDQENRLIAIRKVHELLNKRYEETTEITRVTTSNKNGKFTIKTNTKTIKKQVPPINILREFKGETFEKSLQNLLDCGVINNSTSRKILSTVNQYQKALKACFGEDEGSGMDDEKAIALVKQALLGKGNEIE
ncbi:MAG: hypothetical protein HC836_31160 [Richelia sp. RM2_1_2]|nr:hypothetical protein [Richelia sp. RM2_1_2]